MEEVVNINGTKYTEEDWKTLVKKTFVISVLGFYSQTLNNPGASALDEFPSGPDKTEIARFVDNK